MPTLYYDLASPYSYLAVERSARLLGDDVELAPVLLGALFGMRGHGSWAHTDARAAGMAEVERRAAAYGLPPVAWPPDWPSNSLQAMRAAVWATELGHGRAFALAVGRRAFARGADLGEPSVLLAAAGDAGLPTAELPSAIADRRIKDALRERTDAAWALGVRGIPTARVGAVLFFGDDRLEEAHAAAAG